MLGVSSLFCEEYISFSNHAVWTGQAMAIKDRLELLNLIKGQEVHVPPLGALFFRHWPYAVNEAYEQLRPFVDAMLEEYARHVFVYDHVTDARCLYRIEHGNTVRLNELREADFALFAASFWPYADFEDLKVVAQLSVWLFLWDDEIDEVNGKLTNDMNAADMYRQDTLVFVQSVLGLGTHDVRHVVNTYITAFAPIGEVLKRRCTQGLSPAITSKILAKVVLDQLEMFVSEVAFFMDGSRKEQECRLAGQIPSLTSFWEARLGTSAVGVCDATIESVNYPSPCHVRADAVI